MLEVSPAMELCGPMRKLMSHCRKSLTLVRLVHLCRNGADSRLGDRPQREEGVKVIYRAEVVRASRERGKGQLKLKKGGNKQRSPK